MTSSALESEKPARDSAWKRIDAWLNNASEWLNPILVKEARQSLKSRQFVITFGLMLLAVWGWTAISVTFMQSRGVQSDAGREVFPGYLFILVVPLMVIVPFAAFRSLASEREDGTFELVSITTLAAKQIVRGKLASAMLQVIVYFSVAAPCIAFTYMLRGIDLGTIIICLGYTVIFSFSLTCTGLLLASAVKSIHWQILMTVIMLGGLATAAFAWMVFVSDGPGILRRGISFDDPTVWHINGFIISMVAAFNMLQLAAAVAQLSFASDNRSTKLRIHLLIIQSVFVGWMTFLYCESNDEEFLFAMSLLATAFWTIAGAMMTGEQPVLSPRVRRSLPQSFLGRMAFTWLNPGSASGYVFAVINAISVYLALYALYMFGGNANMAGNWQLNALMGAAIAVAYMTVYLGVGRIVLQWLRKISSFGVIVALMIQALIAVSGILGPLLAHAIIHWNDRFEYTLLQVPNWAWTIGETSFRRNSTLGGSTPIFLLVCGAAGIVFVVNLIVGAREVRQLREETPERVLAEQRALKGVPEQPAIVVPRSPFDD